MREEPQRAKETAVAEASGKKSPSLVQSKNCVQTFFEALQRQRSFFVTTFVFASICELNFIVNETGQMDKLVFPQFSPSPSSSSRSGTRVYFEQPTRMAMFGTTEVLMLLYRLLETGVDRFELSMEVWNVALPRKRDGQDPSRALSHAFHFIVE